MGHRVRQLRQDLANAPDDQKADARWYKARQDELHAAEGDLHTWLRNHGHGATETHRDAMIGHLNDLEDHHSDLVKVQLQHNHPLWLPAATSRNDRQRAENIWSSVQRDAGQIKIARRDADFRSNTLGDIAKLLQHSQGRDMLHELNQGRAGATEPQIRIGADWSASFHSQGRQHKAGSWATPTVPDTHLHQTHHGTGAANTGTGSFVQIDRNERQIQTGVHDDKGVPMPHYITLGHELGHALHNLRGRSAVADNHSPGYQQLPDMDKKLWTEPEEHQNITQNENQIRLQHGLPLRAFHAPPKTVLATRGLESLKARFSSDALYDDHSDAALNALNDIDPGNPRSRINRQDPDTRDPAFFEQAHRRLDALYRTPRLASRQEFRETTTNWLGLRGSDADLDAVDGLLDAHARLASNAPTDRSPDHAHQYHSDRHQRNLHQIHQRLEAWQAMKRGEPNNKYRAGVDALLAQVRAEQTRHRAVVAARRLRPFRP